MFLYVRDWFSKNDDKQVETAQSIFATDDKSSTLTSLESIHKQIEIALNASQSVQNKANDESKISNLLDQAKMILIEIGAFVPIVGKTDVHSLIIARGIFEFGAIYSIRNKDVGAFERYASYLTIYYHDLKDILPPSDKMYSLIALNLLGLLSQNRISEFHTSLESIDPEQLQSNSYIKEVVDLEQFWMEGSYHKIWRTRNNIQQEEFLFFFDILMNTIRVEIASCCEKAYETLPYKGMSSLFFIKDTEVEDFVKQRGWKSNRSEHKVNFTVEKDQTTILPEQIVARTLSYARELERIV